MLSLRDSFESACRSLISYPLRTGLTMLGVVIGNCSFIVMSSLGESAKLYTVQRLEAFHGPNRLIAYPSRSQTKKKLKKDPKLTLADALSLSKAPAIKAVAPVAGESYLARVGAQSDYAWVTGTTADYITVKNEAVAKGRFFTFPEVEQMAKVVVLGSNVPASLFPGSNPLNRLISIKNIPFRVIGVMKAKGTLDKGSPDDYVYVPLSSFSVFLRGENAGDIFVDYIEIGARSKADVDSAIFQATNLLLARRGVRDFAVAPNIPQRDMIAQVSSALTIFLSLLAGVSLLIGGIGIMNVMLVTVSERTSEIGLRKAVGARNTSILINFMIESTLLSAAGGGIGLLLGLVVVGVSTAVTPLPFVLPLGAVVTSLTLSSVVGVAFGVGPAYRASRLDPIEALRSS